MEKVIEKVEKIENIEFSQKEETPFPSDEEEEVIEVKVLEPQKKIRKIERDYFLVEENKTVNTREEKIKTIYELGYLLSFSKWKICEEKKLLGEMLTNHIEKMWKIHEDKRPRGHKGGLREKKSSMGADKFNIVRGSQVFDDKDKSGFTRVAVKVEPINTQIDGQNLMKWGRKDLSEAERLAYQFKEKFEEERKKDPIKNELTELLNILTVDNYAHVKTQIYEKIKGNVADQNKFLDVLFQKALLEKAFVTLYAKICKDMDTEMPQKMEKDARISKMRSKLIDKCKEIFKPDGNTKIDQYIKVSDPVERESKLKKLGNVNFISELINAKLLSRKIVFQCIDNLFLRIEKADVSDSNMFKQINLEAILILMDKFGTLINLYDTKMKGTDDLNEYNRRIDEYLNKLNIIQDNDKTLPGHIRYKIINLIEKKNRDWEESKVDKSTSAKGIKEVREEHESEQRGTTSRGANKLYQEQVNNKIREDLYAWRDHLKNGYTSDDYRWDILENLIKRHKNSVADILSAVGETCIDFISKSDDIQYAYLYVREIINYYIPKLDKNSKKEIVELTLFFLQNLNDFSLDNNLLVNVWGGIIYLLEFHKVFYFSDIDKLTEMQDDQLKTIFEVLNYALGYYDIKEDKLILLIEVNLVKSNQSIFQSLFEK